jgi:hypothetical protein
MTVPALQAADSGTKVACLTVGDLHYTLVAEATPSRCYFQVNGAVKEVDYANGQWNVLGTVPIS